MPVAHQDVTILIVDDDELDIRGIRRGLTRQQMCNPVFVASDGQEALDLLRGVNGRERLPRPYLILLDLNMPRMNGIQFLEELRRDAELDGSIVFVLTTSNSDDDKLAAYKQQVAGYFVKADAGAELLKMIQLLECFFLTVQFPPEPF